MSSFAFGSYVPAQSVLHRMNAQVKIVLACAFSICILFVDTWAGLACFALCTVLLYAIAKVPLGHALRGLLPIAFVLVFTVLAHSCSFSLDSTATSDVQLVLAGSFGLTLDGFLKGLFIALRIALLVSTCALLTFTTSQQELVDALSRILSPLRALRVPVDQIALVVSLALRFVPLVATEAYAVRDAQRARGADFESGSPLARARAWVPVFIPLFTRLFKRAADLGSALDARCFGAGQRTCSVALQWRTADVFALICPLVIVVMFAAFL